MTAQGSFIESCERMDKATWKTFDPFLFCAYHKEDYPQSASSGNDYTSLGPNPRALAGRGLGHDFSRLNGFSMYHGRVVPGFPVHRHYGFCTVTIVRQGMVDHFDSLKGSARYGNGDVQWLSAGSGIMHSEMFPLLNHDKPNPLELIQLWINLPAGKKRTPPTFTVGWVEEQAVKTFVDDSGGGKATLRIVGGSFCGLVGLTPPHNSYANNPGNEVVIATMTLEPGSTITLPPATSNVVNRVMYFFKGSSLSIKPSAEKETSPFSLSEPMMMVRLVANVQVEISCEEDESIAEVLLLQGRPIGEPVFQSGPYVASSRAELLDVLMATHHDTWPWPRLDPVHARSERRFYKPPDGFRHEPPHQA